MKRYRLVLAAGDEVAAFDLVCRDDAEALAACQDRMVACTSAEAWDGEQLVGRWEHAPA